MPDNRTSAADEPTLLIAAALDDWWITTDPAAEFHAPAVAHHLHACLDDHGYTIARKDPAPTRLTIVTGLFVAFMGALATALAIHIGLWVWAAVGAVVTVLTTHETAIDFTNRHATRKHRRR